MEHVSKVQRERWILKGVFRFLSLKIIIISFLFVGALVSFAFIAHEAVYENEAAFDNKVFAFFGSITTVGLISVMKGITFFGSSNFLLPAYILLISTFILMRKFRYGLHITVVALSSTGLMLALKELTHRQRPQLPIIQGITNYSFPSGHALSAFIFCGIFIYIAWHSIRSKLLKWLCIVLLFLFAMAIAVSRIILKVHYPTDVMASFCLGIVWTILSLWVMRRISKAKPPHARPGTTAP